LIEIGSKTAGKNSAQTNKETNRHYENNGHLAVNQYAFSNRVIDNWNLLPVSCITINTFKKHLLSELE